VSVGAQRDGCIGVTELPRHEDDVHAGGDQQRGAAAAEALATFGVAGEDAAREAHGPGSFHVGLYDALAALDPRTLNERARIS